MTKPPPDSETEDDPFAEFAHWRKRDDWPDFGYIRRLSREQIDVIKANTIWLIDRDIWQAKVNHFESALGAIQNQQERSNKRREFEIRFDRHHFTGTKLRCDGLSFPCDVSFTSSRMEPESDFGEATFLGHADFADTTFESGANFERTDFSLGATFDHAEFCKEANFSNATFGQGVTFRFSHFRSHADFSMAEFGQVVDFWSSQIQGEVSFSAAQIPDYTEFKDIYVGSFDISGISTNEIRFLDVHFGGRADFRGLSVSGKAEFIRTSFDEAPDFRDTTFGQSPETAQMTVAAPPLTVRMFRIFSVVDFRDEDDFDIWRRADDVARYRKLKAMALAAHDHEMDGKFFHYEMLAKRGTETTSFSGLLFNSLYWHLSDFGQSFVKPLKWLGFSFAFFAGLYVAVLQCSIALPTIAARWDALRFGAEFSLRNAELSLSNAIPLFDSLFRSGLRPEGEPGWFMETYRTLSNQGAPVDILVWLGVLQSTIGILLLFLLALALRNKFRLK